METDNLSQIVREQLQLLLQEQRAANTTEPMPDIQALIQQEMQRQMARRNQPTTQKKPLGLTWRIASIFPMERKLTKPMHINRTVYKMPAVPKGAPPSIILITDEEEHRYAGFGKNTAGVVPAIDIAEDFVYCTTNFIMGRRNNGSPGVWIVGTLEDGKLSLEQETAIMQARQASFFQEWLDDAREHAAKHEFADITNMHRMAADYLGVKGETWQLQEYKQTQEKCRYCQEFISNDASKCPKCGEIANPEKYARMKREEEALVAAISAPMGRRKTRGAEVSEQETVNV